MFDRKWLLNESKILGLPAIGKSELLARKIHILRNDPKLWTKEDFEIILPHLSIHQDLRADSMNRIESIMCNGLNHGMVDSLYAIVTGKSWSFGQCLRGVPAYIFVTGSLRYKGKNNPYLQSGNKPLFAIFPTEHGMDIFLAIISTAKTNYC